MKKIPYFSHDYNASNDPKILFLRADYGIKGYGIYWYLVEALAQANGKLPMKLIPILAQQMGAEPKEVKEIIEGYDLFQTDGENFFSGRLLGHIQLREEYSEKQSARVKARWNKAEKNKGDSSMFNQMKDKFMETYKERTNTEYYFQAKDAGALKQLQNKLAFKVLERDKAKELKRTPDEVDADVLNAFEYLMAYKGDKFINANFSLPMLNSKFNDIFTQIKTNGTTKANTAGVASAMEKLYSAK